MTYLKKHHWIAKKIENIFAKGFSLDPETRHYITSTFGALSSSLLKDILLDEKNCERDSLLELIIFPNETIQIKMEHFLKTETITREDKKKIHKYLTEKQLVAVILLPDTPETLSVRIDDFCLSGFLSRLNMVKTIDEQLEQAIEKYVATSQQLHVRVKLRNTTFEFTPHRIDFLCYFFMAYDADHPRFYSHLNFILDFLHEHKVHQDIHTALIAKKSACKRNIQNALKFQEQLEKYNIETLMLKGMKNNCINIDEMKKNMYMIDDILTRCSSF